MPLNVTQTLIHSRLLAGRMTPGEEIALRIDQVLLQDVLGTLVMLELEAMGADRVKVDVAAQYIDHNLLESDNLNAEEHLFLRSACRRFGIWYSRPGNGISHPVHMQRFGKPGHTLVGSDSHTAAAGSLGMFAFGAGGIDVALALMGEPVYLRTPTVFGVKLKGELPPWVSAKDIILEMLRRHGLEGGFGRVIEYYGPGVAGLSAMARHVLANMGAELGATTTVFPSDERTRAFLRSVGREDDWRPLAAAVGVRRIYGIVGDSLNGLTDAIRRQGKIRWVHLRHEEVAAFAAGADTHLTAAASSPRRSTTPAPGPPVWRVAPGGHASWPDHRRGGRCSCLPPRCR